MNILLNHENIINLKLAYEFSIINLALLDNLFRLQNF